MGAAVAVRLPESPRLWRSTRGCEVTHARPFCIVRVNKTLSHQLQCSLAIISWYPALCKIHSKKRKRKKAKEKEEEQREER